jgi:hypothetical protein
MPLPPPPLDRRLLSDIMAQLRTQAQIDLPNWDQSPPGDAGVMLQRIFARLMEIAIERLNRVPERNLLAFLDAMGVSLLPPSPAQAAVTFSLLKGSPPSLVPKGTQAGTRSSEQAPPLVFETAQDFTAIPAQLARAFTIDPIWDLYADRTAAVAGQDAVAFTPFVGTERMPHILALGAGSLLDFNNPILATLSFLWRGDGLTAANVRALFESLAYQHQSGGNVATARLVTDAVFPRPEPNLVQVQVELPQGIDVTALQGVGLAAAAQDRWLQAVLTAPFPDVEEAHRLQIVSIALSTRNKDALAADLVFNDKAPIDPTKEFYPLGAVPTAGSCLYVASREAFSKPNCTATLNVTVKPLETPVVIWDFWDGSNWSQLPSTSVADLTNGLSTPGPGTISLVVPASATVGVTAAWTSLFIRGRLISGTYQGHPSITSLTPVDTAHLQAPSSAGANSIQIDTPNFGAVGQVIILDAEYAVVTGIDGQQLTLTPPLAAAHGQGAPVTLKLTAQVATLSAPVTHGQSTPLSAAVTVSVGNGNVLLIDDGFAPEFVTVQSITLGQTPTQITVSSPPRFDHPTGTALAVVGQMHFHSLANDRWADGSQVSEQNPLVPFGDRPGPGDFFTLYTLLKPDAPEFHVLAHPVVEAPLAAAAPITRVLQPTRVNFGVVQGLGIDLGIRQGINISDFGSISVGRISLFTNPFLFGRQVQLNFGVTVKPNLPPIEIAWEYWGAAGWQPIANVQDNTDRFLTQDKDSKTIVLSLGTTVPGEVNGQQSYWIRARLARHHYGIPLEYIAVDPALPERGFMVRPGTGNLHPPILTSLSIDYAARSGPDRVITQNGFLYADETATPDFFAPFVPVTAIQPSAQADIEPAFYIGFDAAFPEQPTNLYVDAAPRAFSGRIVRETSLAPSLLDELSALQWEYFNGVAWSPLPIVDGTNNLTESGELKFETPFDIAPLAKFDDVPRYWIRARSRTNDPLGTQRLDGVFLNTTTAIQAVTVTGEVVGSSNGRVGQSFRLARAPVLPGQRVIVREPEPPSDEEAARLLAEEGVDAIGRIGNPTTGQTEIWVRWHEVNNFLASAPYSRHYTLDHTTGTLTFGALIPPIATQNILANYQSGGGASGNLPAGAIAQVKSSLPAVATVANPTAADGGADPETAAMIEDRGPQAIKHRGYAVAAADIEWLARESAGPRVARAKCIPNVNQELVFEPGWITLLIVPNGTGPKPAPDSQLIREVESYLAARAYVGLAQTTPAKINVIGPGYIRVAVAADVVPVDLAQAQPVEQRVTQALAAYLHPLTGGDSGAGWPFGQSVYGSKVTRLIENVAGVDHVEALQLIANVVQHRLTFEAASEAAVLTQAMTIATPDQSKSARVAATGELPAGRVLIKGFKEGDKIAKVVDVVVQSTNASTVAIDGFTDSAGMPRGSVVMTFDGQQRTRLKVGILPGQTVSSLVLESALDVQSGDVLTLVYPFPMTVSGVTPEVIELTVLSVAGPTIDIAPVRTDVAVPAGTLVADVNGTHGSALTQQIDAGASDVRQIGVADEDFASSLLSGDTILLLAPSLRLDIESYEARLPFAEGSRIATFDNGVRMPLLQAVPAGRPVTAIRLNDFAAGDLLAQPAGAPALAIKSVDRATDLVAMDDNFLVYSGPHRIAMVEA